MTDTEGPIKKIAAAIKSQIKGGAISPDNVTTIVVSAMEIADKLAIDGPTRKTVVISAIEQLIDAAPLDENTKEFIKLSLPATVEVIISATKNKINVNNNTKKSRGCCFG
jgi:hypothetical protein